MANDAQTAKIDIADSLSGLVEEEVVETPYSTFFAVVGIFLWRIAPDAAVFEAHLLVNKAPHTRIPDFFSRTRRRSTVAYACRPGWSSAEREGAARSRPKIVKSCVQGIQHTLETLLPPEVGRAQ